MPVKSGVTEKEPDPIKSKEKKKELYSRTKKYPPRSQKEKERKRVKSLYKYERVPVYCYHNFFLPI